MNLPAWHWFLAALGALLVGVAKTGITGLSLLFVALFAVVMPARQSTGVVLPLLILGDIVAVFAYRRHAQWSHVWRLLPWAGGGIVLGALALGRMNERETRVSIGVIVVSLTVLHLGRRAGKVPETLDYGPWFAPAIGILAGFTSLVANASGPLMVIYLLAMRLPKMEYMGTGAVFFLILNLCKFPLMVGLGLITVPSLTFNLVLAPAVILGTLLGRWILGRIDQRHFENIALALTVIAGGRMFF